MVSAAGAQAAAGDAGPDGGARTQDHPPAAFSDPERAAKLRSGIARIDAIFRQYAADKHVPGMVWGLVIDGQLASVGAAGVQNLSRPTPVGAGTVFRIASMTKSFTALAILKLRDEGRLSLEDPVVKWLPEFANVRLPTRDSAPITIRELLSHNAGFPEDNPWGDQQLAATDAELTRRLQSGIPFSTPPGTRYEYSNYAFALLGRIVTRAAHMPYEAYLKQRILQPLGMVSSTLEFSEVPAERRATGYRLETDGGYREEPPLPQGAFGAMGGMLTNAVDLGRYVAFHLAAWPARDDPDEGPVRRSSVREMSHLWNPSNLKARRGDAGLQAVASGYGFGLRIASDCRFAHIVSHGGGLPGFGSYMAWLPDYGVGLFALTDLTYSGPAEAVSSAWDALLATGGLEMRTVPPSRPLQETRERLWGLWQHWDEREALNLAAVNLYLDESLAARRTQIERLQTEVGTCSAAGPLIPENWLRGQFNLHCSRGDVAVFFTLAPTMPPAVQHLSFQRLSNAAERLVAPTGAPAGVSCIDQGPG